MTETELRQDENLTRVWGSKSRIAILTLGTACVLISLYLTEHFYSAYYLKGGLSGSFCNISSFWNCDSTTFSPISNIFGIPIALFGVLFGLLTVFSGILNNRKVQQTGFFLAAGNALGCLALFVYSLVVIKSLCPGCTLYYVASLLVAIVYSVQKELKPLPNVRVLSAYGAIAVAAIGAVHFASMEREADLISMEQNLVNDFDKSVTYEGVALHSPFSLSSGAQDFDKTPIRINLFSDFECPICGVLATDLMPKILKRYGDNVAIQYFHYPLDHNCNPSVEKPLHQMACKAAYLSSCAGDKFLEVHDWVYSNQSKLNDSLIQTKVNELGVNACYYSEETKEKIVEEINLAKGIGVEATPTLIINGRKLEGILPLRFMFVLLDHVLEQEMQKKKKEVAAK